MKHEEYIRTYTGQVLGILATDTYGDITVYEYPSRRILGYYRKKQDVTTDLLGRVLARGNIAASLVFQNKQ